MTYQLIETKTLGSAQASIEFTSIPQTFTDLLFVVSLRASNSSDRAAITLTINNDSGSNYSYRTLKGFDSGGVISYAGSGTPTDTAQIQATGDTATSNTFSNNSIYFPNYTGNTAKSFSVEETAENNSSSRYVLGIFAYLYNSTSAITRVNFGAGAHNWVVGSTISLYGITRGSSNGVVVS